MAEAAGRRDPALIRAAALAALLLATLVGVARAHEGDELGDSWRWVTFDREAGLPPGRILDVRETPGGVPWVATTEGMAWYDGHAWIRVADDRGHLGRSERLAPWGRDGVAAVVGGEVLLLAPDKVVRLDLAFDGQEQAAWGVAERSPGEFLVLGGVPGTRADKLLIVRPGEPARLDPGAPAMPHQLVLAADGVAFIASTQGVHVHREGGWTALLPVADDRHYLTAAAAVGDEILVSLASPIEMRGTWSVRDPGHPRRISEAAIALTSWHDEGILGAFDSGTLRIGREDAWTDVQIHSDRLRGISTLALGARGDLWAGTDRALHLYRSSSRAWESWRVPGWDLRNYVTSLLVRADGSIWMGTDGGIVIRDASGAVTSIAEIDGVALPSITTVAEDARGRVWVGSGARWSGAWCFDGTGWTHFGAARGLPAERVHSIRTLADGRTFFLCLPAGRWKPDDPGGVPAYLLRDDDTFEPWDESQGLVAERGYDVALGPDGTLWFGTSKGLVRLRDGKATTFGRSEGLPFGRAFCIAVGPDGRAWVGAQERGLAVVGPGDRVEVLTSAAGLVDDDVWGLAFDDAQRLWISTRRGLGVLAGEHFASFRGDSGLPVPRTWPVLPHGRKVHVGTVGGGLGTLDIAAISGQAPRVRLEQPVVDRQAALVRWSALGFWGEPSSDRIETRLRVDEGDWTAWSVARETRLDRLAPGQHSLRVEARGILGSEEIASAESSFVVPHPSWRQAAFLSAVSALLVAGVVAGGFAWTRSRRERRALEASEARYRQLVENATEIVFALDATGRIAWANRAGSLVLGREQGELTGHDVMEAVAPEHRDRARDALLKVRRTGEVVTFELAGIARDGSRRLVEVSLGPGAEGGWQGIGRDVTDQRLREEERQRAQRLESLGLLAGGVAHDFNNVLTAVVGHVGLALIEVPKDSPARQRLEEIERATSRCTALARQLLDHAGRGRFRMERLQPEPVVREAVALAETGLPPKCTVIVECDPGIPAVDVEPAQVQRVIDNLLRNAAEASPLREGAIRVTLRHAADASAVRGSWASPPPAGPVVLIAVSDEGHGMDEATRSRAFDPFFTTRKDGRGLGLAACLGIVRGHGGSIALESVPGRGSTFTVALPMAT